LLYCLRLPPAADGRKFHKLSAQTKETTDMKPNSWLIGLGVAVALGLGLALSVPAQVEKPKECVDQALCADMIRHGLEAYKRGQYVQAKDYFRQAVKADPSSETAWGLYDRSLFYDVAVKFGKPGLVPTAPSLPPGSLPSAEAPSAPPSQQPAAPPSGAPPSIPVIPVDEGC
jgi:tetratricopeptide (TPR) repeat protein